MALAVVTGCTKGIGASIARAFLQKKINIVGCYSKDDKSADRFRGSVKSLPGECELIKADLSDYQDVKNFLRIIKSKYTSVNYLILNAGTTDRTPYGKIIRDEWEKVFRVNLFAPFYITQGLDDIMETGGGIVFVGSILGNYPHGTSLAYAVSKAGLHQMAKNLVKEYAKRNITVNVIAPGFTNTPWQKEKKNDHRQRIENRISMKRFAEPEEIADLCMCVIQQPYLTGSVINVDGGYDFS